MKATLEMLDCIKMEYDKLSREADRLSSLYAAERIKVDHARAEERQAEDLLDQVYRRYKHGEDLSPEAEIKIREKMSFPCPRKELRIRQEEHV